MQAVGFQAASHRPLALIFALTIFLCPVSNLFAQGQQTTLRGRVVYEDDRPAIGLTIELRESNQRQPAQRTEADREGEFQFAMVEAGNYQLVVLAGDLQLSVQLVELRPESMVPVLPVMRVLRPHSSVPTGRGVVSVKELSRETPKDALRAFRRAKKASDRGQPEEAIRQLKDALTLSPDFAEAWNELGALHCKLGDFSTARQAFARVIEINPNWSRPKLSLIQICLNEHQYREAAKLADEVLALENSPTAHYLLGWALVLEDREIARAAQHLQRVTAIYPRAHALLAEIAMRRGQKMEALDQLEKFSPHAPEQLKAEVRARISTLRTELGALPGATH